MPNPEQWEKPGSSNASRPGTAVWFAMLPKKWAGPCMQFLPSRRQGVDWGVRDGPRFRLSGGEIEAVLTTGMRNACRAKRPAFGRSAEPFGESCVRWGVASAACLARAAAVRRSGRSFDDFPDPDSAFAETAQGPRAARDGSANVLEPSPGGGPGCGCRPPGGERRPRSVGPPAGRRAGAGTPRLRGRSSGSCRGRAVLGQPLKMGRPSRSASMPA